MRRKKLLGITLCAVLTIGALLCCMQDASARETLLISGNADLYPIESYDRGRECYVGLLPELYERLSEQTGYDLVYLPYSKNTTQAQQTANRQADIISAYPSGTVDSGAMRRQVLLCTIEHDGAGARYMLALPTHSRRNGPTRLHKRWRTSPARRASASWQTIRIAAARKPTVPGGSLRSPH